MVLYGACPITTASSVKPLQFFQLGILGFFVFKTSSCLPVRILKFMLFKFDTNDISLYLMIKVHMQAGFAYSLKFMIFNESLFK
jgi:hypothetical protein